jgi:type IV pilus assembly protein PilV
MPNSTPVSRTRGFSLIEILVTIVIVAIGLLGIAGLQARLQLSEMEAYQRTQALMLLQDISNRIAANRENAKDYLTASAPVGTGSSLPADCSASTTRHARDLCEWSNALKGAAETGADGETAVGAMIGGRGCVEQINPNEYMITVAWQGLTPISSPAASCGKNAYDGAAGTPCINDLCRRVVTTVVGIGALN